MWVEESSVNDVRAHARDFGRRIIRAIKVGMREGMTVFAEAVGSKINSRTGQTAASILHGVSVTETPLEVRGRIGSGMVGRKPIGAWLENGISVPEVAGKLMVFQGPQGTVFARHHKAFRVPGRHIFSVSLQEVKSETFARIQTRMEEVSD
jgi:hypothetical protein